MDRELPTTRKMRTLAALAMLAAVSSASQALEPSAPSEVAFEASFANIDVPATDTAPEAGAVDLTEIAIPTEEPRAQESAIASGNASYYGRKFHGRRTASGEAFDMNQLTAAHRTLPFGSLVRVTNPANGRSVVVRINDRGPFSGHRVIDLSRAAAEEIGLVARGHGPVQLALVTN